ncbi:hypothetical protein [Sulfitobacter sabulilitoris]|uniref:Aminoglycoside phosphotransferase domain-containing protein n=1 Tax=Sulfitobacter sabulilitoris TaxID=2562655 RepID=A0A5S3Q524_9RHOB|nr:hypothetical protein [Sulfitobacter sabulilitoris]TMM51772.1 hypothetical protein FDT80_13565 [Sulfitobacter sabulilitoris]
MSKSKNETRLKKILAAAEDHFAQPVDRVTAPGGEGRSSFRLHFPDRNVIATLRPNFRRTHLEAHVLKSLGAHCSDLPECLGVVGEIMFQADVGGRRLNQDIVNHSREGQIDLAAQAVAAIFRIQSAARKTTLAQMMPQLGSNVDWVSNFVDAVDFLAPYGGGISSRFDRGAAYLRIADPGRQFVKWDCRSGNAAIGDDDRLRWFDFEYSGLRHGAEDLAWLIGDEAWPIAPDTMVDVVIDAFDPACGHDLADYLDYLSVYLTFHCVQRIKLITKEARKRGWLSKERIRKYDDAGVHPEFALQMCRVGAYFAAQSALTAPLVRNFDGAGQTFIDLLDTAQPRRSA